MNGKGMNEPTPARTHTTVERLSERELVVSRNFNAPAHLVFKAWTNPELFRKWWVPASFQAALLSCDLDARTGGTYRLVFRNPDSGQPLAFFGRYIEVTPHTRIVWTNEESGDGGAVTTVTFQESGGKTHVIMCDLYPSRNALDDAIASGSTGGASEQFEALGDVLMTLVQP